MIEILSSWAKGLGLAIVVVSILEMLLPNNKTKKYIRMVMGIYIIFNIISPLIQNKDAFDITSIDIENYTNSTTNEITYQTSMDERIKELYMEELEKDITKKVEEQGYKVSKCKVTANISKNDEENNGITKIRLVVTKDKNPTQENDSNLELENKIVTEIEKIKKVDTSTQNENTNEETNKNETDEKVSKTDIQNIKKFLIEEYEVNEKCLEIN